MRKGDPMDYDFYNIKVFAESQSSDELILGCFFGKVNGKLEFQFITVARRFKEIAQIDLSLDLNDFKAKLNIIYRNLIAKNGDIISKTNEFSNHINNFIHKSGGKLTFSAKLSHIIEQNDSESIRSILNDMFAEWTSDARIRYDWNCFTFSEMSSEEFAKSDNMGEIQTAKETTKHRKDLMELSDFYPIIDPMEGNQVSNIKIGDSIFTTIIHFTDEKEHKQLQETYPEKFDLDGKNIMPFEAFITSMEFVSKGKGTVLMKIMIDSWFEAKAIIVANIRIMQRNSHKNILKNNCISKDDHFIAAGFISNKHPKNNSSFSKDKVLDNIILWSLSALIFIIVIVILYIIF